MDNAKKEITDEEIAKQVQDGDKEKFEKILEALEDNEDVSDYYTNLAD